MDRASSSRASGSSRPGRLLARLKSAVSKSSVIPGSDSAEGTTTESANEPISDRRREQIRRAQKIHRQRKAEQSERLTTEIADLRARDTAQTSRIDHLESTITFLSDLLNQHGILHEMPKPNQPLPQAQVTVHESPSPTQNSPAQWLQVAMPMSSGHDDTGLVGPSELIDPIASSSLSLLALSPTPLLSPPPGPRPKLDADVLADLNDAQLGIDFILSLEQPCLYHHHGTTTAEADDEDELDLLGHSSQMQAPIMARAPPLIRSTSNTQPHLPPSSSWNVPGEELERLLTFSNQLRLPGEITPVQAWSRIRECANLGNGAWRPSQADLNRLLADLKGVVTCHGFGAVIEKDAFETLLDRYSRADMGV